MCELQFVQKFNKNTDYHQIHVNLLKIKAQRYKIYFIYTFLKSAIRKQKK
ncbi:hypothetical protein AGMMS50239_15460 [Bacteroidia bacterium]|nr:hypothetical protein AGMMS50239_15460 [Bacteroidia bacterium]